MPENAAVNVPVSASPKSVFTLCAVSGTIHFNDDVAAEQFHAAGIRKAMESDLGALPKSQAIFLEKDLARWMRSSKGIEFVDVCGRTHYYAFREPNQ